MKAVQLVIGHDIEHALHLVDGEKVAGHVEHETTVAEARIVLDVCDGQFVSGDLRVAHTGHHVGRKHLLDALESIIEANRGLRAEADARVGDFCGVAFVGKTIVLDDGDKRFRGGGINGHLQVCGGHDGRSETVGFGGHIGRQALRTDCERLWQRQAPRTADERDGARRQVEQLRLGRQCQWHGGEQAQDE